MKKENVIKSCYSILNNVTPLELDCGKICNGKCCKGDEKTGMLVFPGEEKLLDSDISIEYDENGTAVAICGGSCNRNYRPLSCRIYPLFPLLKNDNGKEYIELVLDPRADCPLCRGKFKFTRKFKKAVKRVGKYLLLNEETSICYRGISNEINDVIKLSELLFK